MPPRRGKMLWLNPLSTTIAPLCRKVRYLDRSIAACSQVFVVVPKAFMLCLMMSLKCSFGPLHYGVLWERYGSYGTLRKHCSSLQDITEHCRSIMGCCVQAALKEKRRGKLHCWVLFHQDNTPANTSSEELAAIWNAGFELLHHPPYLPVWLQVTIICYWNRRNLWKEANMLKTKTLSAQHITSWKRMINNSSTIESGLCRNGGPSAFQLQKSMLKRDKIIWCTYLITNYVILQTFSMPLVSMTC